MTPPDRQRRITLVHRVEGGREVYRATLVDGEDVLVHFLPGEAQVVGDAARRARDEVAALAHLRHPAVMPMRFLVRLSGRLALVSDVVDGRPLDAFLKGGRPLSAKSGAELLGVAAEALHRAALDPGPGGAPFNLLHGDLRPEQVLIGRGGEVVLTGFRWWGGQSGSGRTTAPERERTTAADVYSLAATAFWAMTGRHLPEGDMGGVVDEATGLPRELRLLLTDMSHIDPAERPSAWEVNRRARRLQGTLPGDDLRRTALQRATQVRTELAPSDLDGHSFTAEPIEGRPEQVPTLIEAPVVEPAHVDEPSEADLEDTQPRLTPVPVDSAPPAPRPTRRPPRRAPSGWVWLVAMGLVGAAAMGLTLAIVLVVVL